jgi:heme oxygenase
MNDTIDLTLSGYLRKATHAAHARLDQSITSAQVFATIAGYGRFVQMQWAFHREVDALYDCAALASLLPGLASRRRIGLIATDLVDLGLPLLAAPAPPHFVAGAAVDIAAALGWLYVTEGSNLGAAVLRKEAARLGLSDTHGARHLAPAGEGPAAHWRAFVAALDAAPLAVDEPERAVAGAEAAFGRVQSLVNGWSL